MNKKPEDWKLPARYGDPEYPRHPTAGYPICAAYKASLNKFGDPVCLAKPMEGASRCYNHGGATPTGIASVHYEGKGQSRLLRRLPKRLQDDYAAAQIDEQLVGLSNEMALLDSRLLELIGKLDVDGTKAIWEDLSSANDLLDLARRSRDADEIAFQVERISTLIKRGAPESQRWQEVYDVVERKRRLADTIRKIRRDDRDFISKEEQMMFLHQIAEIIRENVKDPESLVGISRGLARLLPGRRSGTEPVPRVVSGNARPPRADE